MSETTKETPWTQTDLAKFWDNRYKSGGNSGNGSYGGEAVMKANIINHWIKEYNIRTITELGCGDGNNLLLYNVPISYCGYDISEKAIQICSDKTKKIPNGLKYFFTMNQNYIDYEADLLLLLDMWYHQTDDVVFEELCHTVFEVGKWKYIICYTTDTDSTYDENGVKYAPHIKSRPFLEKVQQYPQWEVKYWISGFNTQDGKQLMFPSNKRFFLLARKEVLETGREIKYDGVV